MGANLSKGRLSKAQMRGSKLAKADLRNAYLSNANLTNADLNHAKMMDTHFIDLWDDEPATLTGANLASADLSNANAKSANFQGAQLAKTDFTDANLEGCYLYGSSAWELKLEGANQKNLFINHPEDPALTVDNIELAQFLYLLLNNRKIRHVIDTITSKVVLILGRFSEKRKPVLDQLRDVLRDRGLAPVLFDFDKPASKDMTGTVETLARMARFIVADLTDPSSIPHELATIVPFMRTTPVVPIRLKGSEGYSMFDDFEAAYKWVLPKYEYENDQILIESVSDKIIEPAETKVKELRGS